MTGFVNRSQPLTDQRRQRPDWRTANRCATHPGWWELISPTFTATNRRAVDICETVCPVRLQCLIDALRANTVGVIRGGFAFRTAADHRHVAHLLKAGELS